MQLPRWFFFLTDPLEISLPPLHLREKFCGERSWCPSVGDMLESAEVLNLIILRGRQHDATVLRYLRAL